MISIKPSLKNVLNAYSVPGTALDFLKLQQIVSAFRELSLVAIRKSKTQ